MERETRIGVRSRAVPTVSGVILRRADQATVAVLLVVLLTVFAGRQYQLQQGAGRLLDVERAEPLPLGFQVDVNRATWPELSLLPGIGETLARRIVDDRQKRGKFQDSRELGRVRGIGDKKIEAIRQYLLFR